MRSMGTLNKGCIKVNMLEYSLKEMYRNYLQIRYRDCNY